MDLMNSSPDELPDQVLWDAAVAGDADAFGVLFTRHHEFVYNYAFRRTSSWAEAEDLLSVVFLEAWRTRRPMTLGDSGCRPWLVGIANNVIRKHHRSRERSSRALRLVAGRREPARASVEETAVSKIDDERTMSAVLDRLSQLSEADQDVVAACIFAELDYADAAEALGLPVGTVKSRLSRARQRLMARHSDLGLGAPVATSTGVLS